MSEAQRLADQLKICEESGLWYRSSEAAAELIRLDSVEAEWAALSQDEGKAQREIERLRAVNAQLLEALLRLQRRGWLNDHPCAGDDGNRDLAFARTAIKAATGETK